MVGLSIVHCTNDRFSKFKRRKKRTRTRHLRANSHSIVVYDEDLRWYGIELDNLVVELLGSDCVML